MPRSGDVMVYKKDTTLGQTKEFDAQIQALLFDGGGGGSPAWYRREPKEKQRSCWRVQYIETPVRVGKGHL